MIIVAYDGTQDEYDRIIAEKTAEGFILTDVQNITEGNFLGFKEPSEIPAQPEKSTALQELADLKAAGIPKSITEIGRYLERMTDIMLGE